MAFSIRSLALLFLLFGLFNSPFFTSSASQVSPESQLPSGITFAGSWDETDEYINYRRFPALARVDPYTLEATLFYVDEQADMLEPLRWSPQGDRLAFARLVFPNKFEEQGTAELCILSISGELQTCFEDQFSGLPLSVIGLSEDEHHVTWSEDGHSLYFVTQDRLKSVREDKYGRRRLIEADTTTGKTIRTLYEIEYDMPYYPPTITWTPDLNLIAIGVNYERLRPVQLINFKTGDEVVLDTINNIERFLVCGEISPQGFFTAVLDDQTITILDSTGDIIREIDASIFERAKCPTWDKEGNTFYFYGQNKTPSLEYSGTIMAYSWDSGTLTEIVSGGTLGFIFFHDALLHLSPVGTYLAYTYTDGIYRPRISVIYPNGKQLSLYSPFDYAQFPIWEPVRDQ